MHVDGHEVPTGVSTPFFLPREQGTNCDNHKSHYQDAL